MASTPGLKEYRMAYSDRNGVEELSGAAADARRIQNVIFGHGRAGDFGLGVDLQSYLHEISDIETLAELQEKIRGAVAAYCPNVPILEMAVETLSADEDPSGRAGATLIIGISIGQEGAPPYEFAIMARKDASQRIVSSLVI